MTTRKPSNKPSTQKSKRPAKLASEAATVPAIAALAVPDSVDEQTGAAALRRLRPRLMALSAAEVAPLPLNLRSAALAALGVYGLIEANGLRGRLEALGRLGEFDLEQLQLLPDLARATFYCRLKFEQGTALRSDAMVPAALASRGQELRRRMLKLLDFYFEDDPQVSPKLDFIRRGTGYQDLAEDLLGLAEQYREHKTRLRGATDYYKASDERDAARIAAELLSWLSGDAAGGSASPELATLSDLAARASLLLVRAYDEVTAAAAYLCRRDPALAARFQSLYTLSRSRPAASDEAPTPGPAAGDPIPGLAAPGSAP